MPIVQRVTCLALRECAKCNHADNHILVGEKAVKKNRKVLKPLYYHEDCYNGK